MKIKWIPCSDHHQRIPPKTLGDIIEAMGMPASCVVIATDKFIAIDFIQAGHGIGPIDVYYFQQMGNSWHPCKWGVLPDEQRFVIRTSLYNYVVGEYDDDRYYTLEALSGS